MTIVRKMAGVCLSVAALCAVGIPAGAEAEERKFEARPTMEIHQVPDVPTASLIEPEKFNLDDYVGFSWSGKPIVDLDQVVRQIWTGFTNSTNGGVITYTFPKGNHLTGLYNNPNYGFTAGFGYSAFLDAQQAEARQSIALWDDLVAPEFVEKKGRGADINFANSWDPAQAYAYYPEYPTFTTAKGWKFFGDIFVADPAINWTNLWLGFNGYGATTLIHEIGHTLGLSHPGAYNGAGATNYDNQAEYAQDSEQYSIMSYWSPSNTAASIVDWRTFFFGNAQTPMLHDILSIQVAYGADTDTRSDDTVYGFNSTAGRDVFDFSVNPFPNVAIYDAGGNDTIDLSGFNASVFIDLNDGKFSSGGQAIPTFEEHAAYTAELEAVANLGLTPLPQFLIDAISGSYINNNEINLFWDTGLVGLRTTNRYNIAIAYGTVIENAVGGSARDFLRGNEYDNVLNGMAGPDTYEGGPGADTFELSVVEAGDDISDFTTGEDRIDLRGTGVSFSYIGDSAFSGVAGELRYAGGELQGDVDGDGNADLVVQLYGAPLAAGDLVL